ncbi:MAG: tRNA pseudouridine(13) synthase TruD [Thermoplasmatota archaeon]
MTDYPQPGDEERQIGLECFFTDTPGTGGVLKRFPEDFIVEELSDLPLKVDNGPYTIARIKVTNWETNRLIRAMSKNLGVSRYKIKFAGTKDKRAITTQLFSFGHPMDKVLSLNLADFEIVDAYTSNREIELGNLLGNHFNIRVREVQLDETDARERIDGCIGQMVSEGGFPNYFGIQRFGAVRAITHLVGKHIVHGDLEKAVMTYVGNPLKGESEEVFMARERLQKERDFEEAVTYYPSKYIFERSMIHHLKRKPDDWAGALDILPDNLKMMFVHAYQSFIFNKILSKRISSGLALSEPMIGDLVLPMNKKGLPDHHEPVEVTSDNLDHLSELVRKRKGYISGAIIGIDGPIAGGEMGEIERSIIEKEGVELGDFEISEVSRVSSRGMRREILAPVFDLKWRLTEDDGITPQFDFSLFRGTYATSFMREIMKGNVLDY